MAGKTRRRHSGVRAAPHDLDARFRRGSQLFDAGQLDAGIAYLQSVVRDAPAFSGAHAYLGMALLQKGEFERGWREYQWRHGHAELITATSTGAMKPAWDGTPLSGRSIVLLPEQGLGDTIQFARYAPLVAATGARVILGCPLPLKRLLGTLQGVDQVASGDDPPVTADEFAPLLDLPGLLGTTLDSVPATVPYLHADLALIEQWGARMTSSQLRVGLVWAGNPANARDARRSTKLDSLAPLFSVEGISFYSLQKGAGAIRPPIDWPIVDLEPYLTDFAETAAAIMHLDLVVAVDTAVAHLAGALGRPVWLLLSRTHDWRWIDGWSHSPWYPSMRIFRQEVDGDWPGLARLVASELTALAADRFS